jgi:uncharacterized membrane protein
MLSFSVMLVSCDVLSYPVQVTLLLLLKLAVLPALMIGLTQLMGMGNTHRLRCVLISRALLLLLLCR